MYRYPGTFVVFFEIEIVISDPENPRVSNLNELLLKVREKPRRRGRWWVYQSPGIFVVFFMVEMMIGDLKIPQVIYLKELLTKVREESSMMRLVVGLPVPRYF